MLTQATDEASATHAEQTRSEVSVGQRAMAPGLGGGCDEEAIIGGRRDGGSGSGSGAARLPIRSSSAHRSPQTSLASQSVDAGCRSGDVWVRGGSEGKGEGTRPEAIGSRWDRDRLVRTVVVAHGAVLRLRHRDEVQRGVASAADGGQVDVELERFA